MHQLIIFVTLAIFFIYDVSACDTFQCECSAIDGLYVNETESCLFVSSVMRNWRHSFEMCQNAAVDNFTTEPAYGRLAHVETDLMADIIRNNFIDHTDFHIGMRSDEAGNATKLSDYFYWMQLNNNNARKTVPDLANVTTKSFVIKEENCGHFHVEANGWFDLHCASNLLALCEIIVDKCNESSCIAPKVCAPDSAKQVHCVCPNGAVNDANCGVDCAGKPDGNYAIGVCVQDYYSCASGVITFHQCGTNESFDGNTKNCSCSLLECHCETTIGGYYVPHKQSCMYTESNRKNWHFSFQDCINKAESYRLPNLIGRLAHLDDVGTTEAVLNHEISQMFVGLRSTTNGSSLNDYHWWFDPFNKNAVINATPSEYMTSDIENDGNAQCPNFHAGNGHKKFYPRHCASLWYMSHTCEFIQNGLCNEGTPCQAPKECYPDANEQFQCFCPSGSANDDTCGVNCDGKDDGDYGITSCIEQYYSCISGSPVLNQCASGEFFDLHIQACSPRSNNMACKCKDLAGIFDHDSSSCIIPGWSNQVTWRESWLKCQTKVGTFGIDGLFGRLAHLTTHSLVDAAIEVSAQTFRNIGMHSIHPGTASALDHFGWWFDIENSNAFLPISDTDPVTSYDFENVNSDCGIHLSSMTEGSNKWYSRKCSPSQTTYIDVCQVFYDQCEVANPCVAPKVCSPDINNRAICFCPNGAISDEDCGMNCTGKADGQYHIGACASDYYTCSNEIFTIQQCANNQVFDPFFNECADASLSCKCTELGGHYITSTQSCMLDENTEKNWFDSFTHCHDLVATFGIDSVAGRLLHMRNVDTVSAMNFYTKQSYNPLVGARSIDTTNPTELESYFWWFDPHNSNAVLPLTELFGIDTQLDDPSKHCIKYYHGKTNVREKLVNYACNQWQGILAQCEIFCKQQSLLDYIFMN